MELNYRKAVQDDAELLIEMYNAAFHADYIRYGECPAYGDVYKRQTPYCV